MANGTTIAKAYVQIIPSTEGIKSNLSSAFNSVDASGAGESTGNSFVGGFGAVLGGLAKITISAVSAAATGVVALTKEAVSSYANYEQLVGGMETLYKENADTMVQYASEAYKTAGLSANEYMETATSFSASLLAATGGDTQRAADAANQAIIDMSDNANKMGTSMESIQNAYRGFAKQNYTMLDNLSLGYGGTKSEMERLLVDAEKLTGIKYDISSLDDVYSAIHVIQTELGITGTTAIEAGDTISGSAGSMSAAWKNLLTGLADDNADFDTLINNLVSSVTVAMGNLVPRITQSFQGIGKLIKELAPVISQMLPEMINSFIPPLLEAATTLVIAIVDNLSSIVQPIIDEIPVIVNMLMEILPDFITAILDIMPILLDAALQVITDLINGIAQSLPIIMPQIVELIIEIGKVIGENAEPLMDAALLLIKNLGNGLLQALPQLVAQLPVIIENIINFFTESFPQIMQIGTQLLTSLVKELPTICEQITAALPELIDSLVEFFVANYPVFYECGMQLFMALIENLPQIIEGLVAHMPEIVDSLIKGILAMLDQMVQCGFELFVSLVQNMPLIIAEIIVALDSLLQSILETLAYAYVDFVDVGTNIIKGIGEGISGALDWILGIVKDLCSSVWNEIAGFFDVHSPSRKMKWLGTMLDEGLALGIDDSAESAVQSALGLTEDVMNEFDGLNGDLEANLNGGISLNSSNVLDVSENENNAQMIDMLGQYLPIIASKDISVSFEGDADNMFNLIQKKSKIYNNQYGKPAFN